MKNSFSAIYRKLILKHGRTIHSCLPARWSIYIMHQWQYDRKNWLVKLLTLVLQWVLHKKKMFTLNSVDLHNINAKQEEKEGRNEKRRKQIRKQRWEIAMIKILMIIIIMVNNYNDNNDSDMIMEKHVHLIGDMGQWVSVLVRYRRLI